MLRQDIDPSSMFPDEDSEDHSEIEIHNVSWKSLAELIAEKGSSVDTIDSLTELVKDVCEMLENIQAHTLEEGERTYMEATLTFLSSLKHAPLAVNPHMRGFILDLLHDKMILLGDELSLFRTFNLLWETWFGNPLILVPLDVLSGAFEDAISRPHNVNIHMTVLAMLTQVVQAHDMDSAFMEALLRRKDCIQYLHNGLKSSNPLVVHATNAFLQDCGIDADLIERTHAELDDGTETGLPSGSFIIHKHKRLAAGKKLWSLHVIRQCLKAMDTNVAEQMRMKNDPQLRLILNENLRQVDCPTLQVATRNLIRDFNIEATGTTK
eukprot:Blabericola_migrator_1__4690@NODE_2478_length_2704_cov_97_186955_g1554_i0_p2_GENE_NODE_2478_length_2704_cov_97_186955_g1554_i0NODE_2478_length_2704_cov_97_186955_g1554_i0_p2_ORF_typecomplete_len323_score64_80ATHILA/PF03078_15/0_14_NODE_2478_length_2704_cov_97_186955_g1554_i01411109